MNLHQESLESLLVIIRRYLSFPLFVLKESLNLRLIAGPANPSSLGRCVNLFSLLFLSNSIAYSDFVFLLDIVLVLKSLNPSSGGIGYASTVSQVAPSRTKIELERLSNFNSFCSQEVQCIPHRGARMSIQPLGWYSK